MNYPLIFRLIGNMLKVEALFMLLPLSVSIIYGTGDHTAFLWSIVILASFGFLLSLLKPKEENFRTKDAFAAASLTWLLMSLLGALPFYFSGCFNSYIDCAFETISGFTTTGASILTEIESLPKGILFWRSFTHLIGGMGVLVFMLAVMPPMHASAVNLLMAESTGPAPNKVVPKIRETAKVMYLIYLAMTVVLIILLFVSGLPFFDSLVNAFSIAGTGGFSNMNASFGAYNNVTAEVIATVFMFLFGISFTLYFYLLNRNFKQFFKDEELRFFFWLVVAAIVIITIDITKVYDSVLTALRHSSFQVSTIISTTGYSTTDFNLWPTLSKTVLVLLMFTGCCAGSTGGGIKLIRILLLFKAVKITLEKLVHPKSVKALTVNGKKMSNDVIMKAAIFFFVYFVILIVSTILVSIDGKDIVSSSTAVISMLSNVGPGLGLVGPTGNYSSFSAFSKIILSFCMIAGRLEFFPILILFKPSIWKK